MSPDSATHARLIQKSSEDDHAGCWLWTGARDGKGYGMMSVSGRLRRTHLISYEMFVGEIPAGLTLDHRCRRTGCWNYTHLEPVTRAENTRRQLAADGHWNSHKTECINGHPFDEQNTKIVQHHGAPARVCRTCANVRSREHRERKKARQASRMLDI